MLFLYMHFDSLHALLLKRGVRTYHFCPNRTRLIQEG
jgi:hypothetical protein